MIRTARTIVLTLALIIALSFGLTSCAKSATSQTPAPAKSSLQVVATMTLDVAQTIGALQTAVIDANARGLVPINVTREILTVTSKAALAGKQVDAVLAGLTALGPAQKGSVLAIIQPVFQAVNDSLNTGLITISDPNTANAIRLLLTTLQGSLAAAQIALSGGN